MAHLHAPRPRRGSLWDDGAEGRKRRESASVADQDGRAKRTNGFDAHELQLDGLDLDGTVFDDDFAGEGLVDVADGVVDATLEEELGDLPLGALRAAGRVCGWVGVIGASTGELC